MLAACSAPGPRDVPDAPPAPEPLAWVQVPLPAGSVASSLTSTGVGLLVGGRGSAGGWHPVLLAVGADDRVRAVPLRPHSPYAEVADLVSAATDGRRVVALGAAHGGAHANVRWTVWSGTVEDGLDDRPQLFETFGGQSAGSLLDVVWTADAGPVIAGSWVESAHGLDAAIWTSRGSRWQRQPSRGTPLVNTATLQVAPRAAAAHGSALLLSGSTIGADEGEVRQRAAVWRRPGADRPWALLPLPGTGSAGEARSIRCAAACWASGQVDGSLALWRLDPEPVRETGLPAVAVDADGAGARTVLPDGAGPGVLASAAGTTVLTLQTDRRWRTFAGPDGDLLDAATASRQVYALVRGAAGTTLWRTDAASAADLGAR